MGNEKQDLWKIAIGLNKVDNLTQSEYFYVLMDNYEKMNLFMIREFLLFHHWINKNKEEREADLVALNIMEYLSSSDKVKLDCVSFKDIHKKLFRDAWKGKDALYAGVFRRYDIAKSERVLHGQSVEYLHCTELEAVLEHDFDKEKKFDYENISTDKLIRHISYFISNIWQIHPFIEGNTRTTTLFLIKYLNQMNIAFDMNIFIDNTKYFRDALVLANSPNKEDFQYLK